MLRRYIVLPAILLALGVGEASAMTCKVKYDKGVYLRSSTLVSPNNRLCKFFPQDQQLFDSERNNKIPWVKVFVADYPPPCPEALENDKRGFVGYMLEYAWVKEEGKCMHILSCDDPQGGRTVNPKVDCPGPH